MKYEAVEKKVLSLNTIEVGKLGKKLGAGPDNDFFFAVKMRYEVKLRFRNEV